jgi:hypothetical protein
MKNEAQVTKPALFVHGNPLLVCRGNRLPIQRVIDDREKLFDVERLGQVIRYATS